MPTVRRERGRTRAYREEGESGGELGGRLVKGDLVGHDRRLVESGLSVHQQHISVHKMAVDLGMRR